VSEFRNRSCEACVVAHADHLKGYNLNRNHFWAYNTISKFGQTFQNLDAGRIVKQEANFNQTPLLKAQDKGNKGSNNKSVV
jgi:hypothetical protein